MNKLEKTLATIILGSIVTSPIIPKDYAITKRIDQAIGAISGGIIGGKLASKIKQEIFRWIIVIIGLAVAIYYFIK